VGFAQPRVEPWLETDARAHDLRRLVRAAQVGGPQSLDRVGPGRHAIGQLARLRTPGLVQRRVAEALKADRLTVVVGLTVTGEQHPGEILSEPVAHRPPMPSVSERKPSRSVSSASTSPTGTLLRLTSEPNRRTNHTCWSLRGASNMI